jgi:predicted acyl esterase
VNPRTEIDGDMRVDFDIAIPLRDGGTCLVDVFRPRGDEPVPALLAWGPYGKHGPLRLDRFPGVGVKASDLSPYTAFEAPDPVWWSRRGYAVVNADPRGLWETPGQATFLTPQEAEDAYDVVEWLGTREWANGKVGLAGVSYLGMIQWHVAALRPPHLAAINPWEAMRDLYRDLLFHGGIPETHFIKLWNQVASFSNDQVENLLEAADRHPLHDDYWSEKVADISAIEVPTYVLVGWADQGIHTKGTIEAFEELTVPDRWLDIYSGKKLNNYYSDYYHERQLAFFDTYLRGIEHDLARWPRVRLEIREEAGSSTHLTSECWPPAESDLRTWFLDASNAQLVDQCPTETTVTGYASLGADGGVDFTLPIEHDVKLVGSASLKLWVSTDGAADMDLFVSLEKIDANGRRVGFDYLSNFEDGSVALGWLRASHRALDESLSRPNRPWHPHTKEEPLQPGEVYPVEIEIWPSGTSFNAGDTLVVRVKGSDINVYPDNLFASRHSSTRNVGTHRIHCGGPYDSKLIIPVIS